MNNICYAVAYLSGLGTDDELMFKMQPTTNTPSKCMYEMPKHDRFIKNYSTDITLKTHTLELNIKTV